MKIFLKLVWLVLFCLFLASCYKKYSRTINICDRNLFVERYRNNVIDIAYYYLTDSTNFRIYIGKFDNEHGGFSFKCLKDSIAISEIYEDKVINIKKYSLADLQKGIYQNQ